MEKNITIPTAKNAFAVIMAGGKGERFWPQSRSSHPKQLLRLLGNLTLIEQTVERLHKIFAYDHILIITNDDYVAPMRTLMPNLPQDNILSEPMGRDTAPCIAYAVAHIKSISSGDPVLAIVPSDHIINDTDLFAETLSDCIGFAETHDQIVTIGLQPTYPSTGYGYIKTGSKVQSDCKTSFFSSLGFTEKPSFPVAEEYFKSGNYRWNGGMFIFRSSVMRNAFQLHSPALMTFSAALDAWYREKDPAAFESLYASAPKISIDYAVMEKVDNITVANGVFDWDDIGSWTSMRNQIRPGVDNNVVRGLHVGIDTKNCIVVGSPKHLIATVDVQDLIIVNTDDATLVCSGKSAQRIKELVQLLSSKPELKSFL